MWWILAFSLVTGLPPAPPPHYGFIDAARLATLCKAQGDDAASARSLCLGYIVGAVDQLFAQQARSGQATICPPGDLTADDAMAAVVRHARFASTADGLSAADFVRLAMEIGYPCAGVASAK